MSVNTFLKSLTYLLFKNLNIASVIITIICSFYIVNKGFEISDESYYLLNAKYPDSILLYVNPQQWILNSYWNISNSLVYFRILGLLTLIFSSQILALGTISILRKIDFNFMRQKQKFSEVMIFLTASSSALLYGQTINFSPSYNLLANAAGYIAFGFTLLTLKKIDSFVKVIYLVVIALAISVQFMVKPPSALGTLALISLVVIYFEKKSFKKIFFLCLMTTFFAVIYVLINTNFEQFLYSTKNGLELYNLAVSESYFEKLIRHINDFKSSSINLIYINFFLFIILLLYKIFKRVLFAVVFCGIIFYNILSSKIIDLDFYTKDFVLQILFITTILFCVIFISFPEIKNNKDLSILLFTLFLLPYAIAVGTTNNISTHIIISLAPWGIIFALLAGIDYANKVDKFLVMALLSLHLLFVASQMTLNLYKRPYHLIESYLNQKHDVIIPGLGKIKVDLMTKNFIDDLSSFKRECAIPSQVSFFGFYNIPGAVFGLDGIPKVIPWINNLNQAEFILNFTNLDDYHVLAVNNPIIGWDGGKLPELIDKNKDNYVFCGATEYPYANQVIQIWIKAKAHT